VAPEERSLLTIKAILNTFGRAYGLFANLDKSLATPLHCTETDMELVLTILSCKVQEFPCRYLGIPLSVYKLKRADEQPLIDKIAARIPGWKGRLLNVAGRSTLVKCTLSAIPVHTSIALGLSPWAIAAIDKLRRAFIWTGSDKVAGGKCKVAWINVCRPKELGGLGIADLRRAGLALRVRWIWRDRKRGIVPPACERVALRLFQAATTFTVGNGESTLFWTDRWLNGSSIVQLAPAVFAAVRPRKRRASVSEALNGNAWVRHLSGAVSMTMLLQFGRLCDLLENVQLSSDPDVLSWHLTESGNYSAASAYGAMFLGSSPVRGAAQLWKTAAPPRVRFFYWLALQDRCWTGERRHRHGLQPTDACITCDQEPETIDHILLGCAYSREVWATWMDWLHLPNVDVRPQPFMEWWLSNRKRVDKHFRRGFDSIVFLIGWMLWKQRNARTFDGSTRTARELAVDIRLVAEDWRMAGYRQLGILLSGR